MIVLVQRCFFACPWQSKGVCRQINLPHATFSHLQSLHKSHSTNAWVHWLKGPLGSSLSRPQKSVIHPRVMFHLASHSTLNTSTSSLSLTSPVLLSSSSPNPDSTVRIHGGMVLQRNSTPPQIQELLPGVRSAQSAVAPVDQRRTTRTRWPRPSATKESR